MAGGGLLPLFLMLVKPGSMRRGPGLYPRVPSVMGMKANGCRPQAVLWQHLRASAAQCSDCSGRSATAHDLRRLSDEREKRVSCRLVQQLFQPRGPLAPGHCPRCGDRLPARPPLLACRVPHRHVTQNPCGQAGHLSPGRDPVIIRLRCTLSTEEGVKARAVRNTASGRRKGSGDSANVYRQGEPMFVGG
jgi:hypothetical protein